jgi:hypothetical protein
MIEDVNEEVETSSDQSSEETNEDDSKVTDESKDVPYKRFSDVVKERNEAREAARVAEDKLKATKEALEPKEPEAKAKSSDSLTREEAILYAKGYDDETVERLKKIATVEDVSILEAEQSDLFTAWKEKREVDTRNQSAQLGASNGSAPHVEESFKPGMAKGDHKALWAKASGK